MAADSEARRRAIKRELRELARRPDAPGAAQRAQRLTAEYRRLVSAHRAPAAAPTVADKDAAAMATWPAELRARVQDGALSRVLVPWGSD
ncbi:hypothetical protein [Streptomyces sp. NPDC001221]